MNVGKFKFYLKQQVLHRFQNFLFTARYPFGHFYSPVTDPRDIARRKAAIFKESQLLDLNLNSNAQEKLLAELAIYYSVLPFSENPQKNFRYYFNNQHFSYADSIFLYSMIRHFSPKRIIEAGSGYSSAVMLDTNEHFMDGNIKFSFIEPYPKRLKSLLKETDKKVVEIKENIIQNIPVSFFEVLEENDFLFIDSTHVSKTGSDVNYILFEILPRLKKGVIIHFHDIFYPFEYLPEWVLGKGFGWNEIYLLRAFLMYNSNFEIIAFNTYLEQKKQAWFEKNMPLCLKNTGGSIYLKKLS
jgi:hypothetical protein